MTADNIRMRRIGVTMMEVDAVSAVIIQAMSANTRAYMPVSQWEYDMAPLDRGALLLYTAVGESKVPGLQVGFALVAQQDGSVYVWGGFDLESTPRRLKASDVFVDVISYVENRIGIADSDFEFRTTN